MGDITIVSSWGFLTNTNITRGEHIHLVDSARYIWENLGFLDKG